MAKIPHYPNFSLFLKKAGFSAFFIFFSFYSSFSQNFNTNSAISLEDGLKSMEAAADGFTENKGQMADQGGNPIPNVLFKTNVEGADLYITTKGLSYVFLKEIEEKLDENSEAAKLERSLYEKNHDVSPKFEWVRVDMNLQNATILSSNVIKENVVSVGSNNYFLGHCPHGVFDVKTYGKVTIANVYPGIDWVFHANGGNIKYDFVVHPGANPDNIKMQYIGGGDVNLGENNSSIKISTSIGELVEGNLFSFQEGKKEVASSYVMENGVASFRLGNYNTNEDLIIDPPLKLWWSTYVGGGSNEGGRALTVDKAGNVYITGFVISVNYPMLNAYQGTITVGTVDAFITKFNNNGAMLWSTYYGGNADDRGEGIAADNLGNVYVTGGTRSSNFPLKNLPGAYNQASNTGATAYYDIMILKFDASGVCQWATTYGGENGDKGMAITTDNSNNVYITGYAGCNNFPTFDPGGGAFHDNTYGGGDCTDFYLGGDACVIKFDAAGVRQWATLLGGNGVDVGLDIKVSPYNGNIFVTGFAKSTNFTRLNPTPGTSYFQNIMGGSGFLYGDAYVTEFNGTNYSMLWSTYYGGDGSDAGEGIDVDANGNVFIVGSSASTNLPVQNLAGAYNQANLAGPLAMPFYSYGDWFIVKFDNTRARQWATYYGGTRSEVALDVTVDPCGNLFVTGRTCSADFPTLTGGVAYYYDGSHNGGTGIYGDIAIVSFDNNGVHTWGTFYGGSGDNDAGWELSLDWKGKAFVTGEYSSSGLGVNPTGGAYYDGTYNGGPNDAYVLSFKPLLKPTASQTPVSCYGGSDGIATVNPVGGVPAMTYTWSTNPVQNTQSASNLPIGIYSVTVADAYCAKDTVSIQITQPPQLQASIPTFTNALCYGSLTGGATAVGNGGTGAYTFSWNPSGQTNNILSGVVAGTYTATVTDANGCTAIATITLTEPPQLTLNITAQNDVTCFNYNNGYINTSTAGGTGAYTYNWSNSPTTPNNSNLGAGTYSLTVTDGNGCTTMVSAAITEPALLMAFIPSQTDIRCYGEATGGAQAGAIGGTSPYNYSWSPGGAATQSISNVIAGVYSVTITDVNGCSAQKSVTLTEPPVLAVNITSQTDILCNGDSTGSISINVAGGITPYNYSWNPTTQTGTTVTGLAAGAYNVVITDNNACTVQTSTTLNEPTALTMNLSSTPDHCLLSDGTVNAVIGGGVTNYIYNWSNNGNTSSMSNLGAGVYTLTVTDNNGCTIINSIAVVPQQGDTLQFVSKTGTACYLGCDGTAALQLSGNGNAPYTYMWSGPVSQTNLNATGLCAGLYTCTVTDASGCKDTMQVMITQPTAIATNINATSVLCFGENNGTATIQQNGGTPGYTYVWDDGQTTPTATGLYAGLFSCTVTDLNGCTTTASFNITEPSQLVVNINGPTSICAGQTANLIANAAGGTPTYSYLWNPGGPSASISVNPLTPTNYNVTATDANGCTAQAITTIAVNALPDISFAADVVSGCGPLCVTFTNNTANTAVAFWNFGDNNISSGNPSAANCYTIPGAYTVSLTITDVNGCSATNSIVDYITVHPDPVALFKASPQPASILSPNVYFTDLSTGAMSWQWTFGDMANGQSALQNPNYVYPDTGNYTAQLIVTNEFGCTDTTYDVIRINPDFVIYVPNTFTPNGDNINDVFKAVGIGMDGEYFEFLIYDRWGDVIFKSDNPEKGWDGKANNGDFIAQQDTYVWKITMKDVLGNKHRYVGNVNLIR